MWYIIQVTAYSGLLWVVYYLLLRNRPMHAFNRSYLLTAVLLPVALPLIYLPSIFSTSGSGEMSSTLNELVITAEATKRVVVTNQFAWVPYAYMAIVVAILLVRLAGFVKMKRVINRSEHEQREGFTVLAHTGYGPGSWGKYIFLPEGDVDNAIIEHEYAHIKYKHSRDMLLINIVQAIMWPNLFIHLLKRELVQVHEFQADSVVDMPRADYSGLLLASVFNTCRLPFTHSFIIHPIKRRIMMLQKNKVPAGVRGVAVAALTVFVAAGVVSMQSCEPKQDTVNEKTDIREGMPADALQYTHKMPEAEYNVYQELAHKIVYPAEAKAQKIEGRVNIRFVVDKDGHITNVQPMGTKNNQLLVDAAITAVAALPDWKPGEDEQGNPVAVWFTLPVTFKLDSKPGDANAKKPDNSKRSEANKSEKTSAKEPNKLSGDRALYVQQKQNVYMKEDGSVSYTPKEWQVGVDENGNKKRYWKVPLANTDGLEIRIDEEGQIDIKDPAQNKDFDHKVTFIAGETVTPTEQENAAVARRILDKMNEKK